MRRGRVLTVARRELVSTVRRPSWLLTTFGMPVIVLLYAGLALVPSALLFRAEARRGRAGVVDRSGLVRIEGKSRVESDLPSEVKEALALAPGRDTKPFEALLEPMEFLSFPDRAAGLAALEREEISVLFLVPLDYVKTGKVEAYRTSSLPFGRRGEVALRRLLARGLAEGELRPDVLERVLTKPLVMDHARTRDGRYEPEGAVEIARTMGVPIGFMVLLFASLMASSGYLLQGVTEEKENRVIEVVLSSIDATSLLLGKLLGLGAAGLIQLAVWLTMAVVPQGFFLASFVVTPGLVLLSFAYFVLGFLLYGTLMTVTGAIGTNAREGAQYAMFWSVASIAPILFFPSILDEPNGVAARILSYVPLTTPFTMMLRLGTGAVPGWEVVLSLLWLALAVAVTIRLAAKVFRTVLLLYGKRPRIREIVRWAREA